MIKSLCVALSVLLMLARAGNADTVITGRVVDAAGKPVAGINVTTDYAPEEPAITGADGRYRLTGLHAGRRVVRAEDATGHTVAMPLNHLTINAGETTTAGDIIMSAGGIIEGTVTDAGSGQGLGQIAIGIYTIGGLQAVRPEPRTDAQGHFKTRVPPGHFSIRLQQQPPGFPAARDGHEVVVAQGTSQTIALQLARGQSVRGAAVDTDNQPVAGLSLQLMVRSGTGGYGRSVKAGDDGAWSLDDLPAGEVTMTVPVLSNVELVSPKTFTLPAAQPIKVVVRKLDTLPLRGRVVTTAGAPVAHLPLNVSVQIKLANTGTSTSGQSYSTDAMGRLDVAAVRSDAKITVGQLYSGYRYRSGGAVTQQGGAFAMSELVLAPLTARLEGTVVDGGAPVAGATVLSPDGDVGDSTITDAQGHFTLGSLPEGQPEITVLAAYQGHYAGVHANVADAVQLRLTPLPPPPQPDLERGYALLKKLWEAGPQGVAERDEKLYQTLQELWPGTPGGRYRNTIPVALAVTHPDLALKLISQSDAITHDSVLSQIITTLAAANPVLAATWAPGKLALFQDRDRSIAPTLTLALAIADVAPDAARPLYQQVRDYVQAHRNDDIIASSLRPAWFARLALLAVRLDPGAVRALSNDALAQVKTVPGSLTSVIATLIAVYPDDMDTLLNQLAPRERTNALATAAPLVAVRNLSAAQRVLDRLQQEDDPNSPSACRRALVACITAIGLAHPDQAMTLASGARSDQDGDEVLLAAAQFQPRDQALTLLRKLPSVTTRQPLGAGGMDVFAMGYYSSGPAEVGRVAALAYEGDPAWGEKLFADDKERLRQQLTNRPGSMRYGFSGPMRGLGVSLASFAYYYSRVDPAESRLLLESAFADASRRTHAGGYSQPGFSPFQNSELAAIVTAMAAIDTNRALAMAASLTADGQRPTVRYGPSPQMSTYSKIGEYLVTSEPARRLRPFMQWSGIASQAVLF